MSAPTPTRRRTSPQRLVEAGRRGDLCMEQDDDADAEAREATHGGRESPRAGPRRREPGTEEHPQEPQHAQRHQEVADDDHQRPNQNPGDSNLARHGRADDGGHGGRHREKDPARTGRVPAPEPEVRPRGQPDGREQLRRQPRNPRGQTGLTEPEHGGEHECDEGEARRARDGSPATSQLVVGSCRHDPSRRLRRRAAYAALASALRRCSPRRLRSPCPSGVRRARRPRRTPAARCAGRATA